MSVRLGLRSLRTATKDLPFRGVRYHHASPGESWHLGCAVAFDIDGVLTKGKRAIPSAIVAMKKMNGANRWGKKLPYILLTNGGGVTEAEKAHEISAELGVNISPNQVVLSHSPMKSLLQKHQDHHILVVGGAGRRCADVAAHYGFTKVSIPEDIIAWNPSVWPFTDAKPYAEPQCDYSREPIDAIMMLYDSRDWGRDLQIITDILQSPSRTLGQVHGRQGPQSTPVYFSNPDIVWSNEFPTPRFAQGCFRLALQALYKQLSGHDLEYQLFGKPHAATYTYALDVLRGWGQHLTREHGLPAYAPPMTYYAIGDNPESDVRGANGQGWHSILVRTGIYQHPHQVAHDPQLQARHVVEDVDQAIDLILERELGSP
ncbi:hypothetical protein H4R33_000158 [Dimargaris cristalligena]|uniref:HAD-like domain-containing protein n=1 Tax=Dimargaris cristalligena TaxID=215637 RepID=A0A4Q0A4X7_9FUNG|nr:hypothetical protein H4R33_000158 [Dimargaris cristalligena]RKP40462.1 HAD-like domain-containing protein [Dimargaris cristalligena]|eukprot:RKP40462.1 HAD-like domain-containing protein [Dimargaris cristalligena]